MRSAPTGADLALLGRLAEQGYKASRSQLERWRQRGLLPRAQVRRERWGGSEVLPHPQETYDLAAVLSQWSGRGRPWQTAAAALFEEGLPVSADSIRATAVWLMEVTRRHVQRRWQAAAQEVPPDPEDPHGEAIDIGFGAAELVRTARSSRALYRVVREDVRRLNPFATEGQVTELTERALTWRVIDLVAPQEVRKEEERNIARYGREDDEGDAFIPTPAEALACATTLSAGEAYRYRRLVLLRAESQALEVDGWVLGPVVWAVASDRLMSRHRDATLPLSPEDLREVDEVVQDLEESLTRQEDPAQLSLFGGTDLETLPVVSREA